MRYSCFLLLCLLLSSSRLLAQAAAKGATSTQFNQEDSKGRPHGWWWIQQPARMGEDAYAEFGTYEHGIKYGTWYKLDNESQIQSIEHFRNGVLDGEVKYFEKGHLTVVGHYRGLNPAYTFDTILIVHPVTGLESFKAIPTERGTMRHGTWRYYDPQSGRLVREVEYQVDEILDSREFGLSAEDSTYYQQKIKALPHNRKHPYVPPPGKRFLSH